MICPTRTSRSSRPFQERMAVRCPSPRAGSPSRRSEKSGCMSRHRSTRGRCPRDSSSPWCVAGEAIQHPEWATSEWTATSIWASATFLSPLRASFHSPSPRSSPRSGCHVHESPSTPCSAPSAFPHPTAPPWLGTVILAPRYGWPSSTRTAAVGEPFEASMKPPSIWLPRGNGLGFHGFINHRSPCSRWRGTEW